MTFAIDTGPSADFYDFDRVVTGILGMPRPVRSVFGPPELAQAPADLSTATVGLLVTSGAYYPDQPRMRETGDLSFRLLPRTRDLTDILSMVGSIHDYDRLATGTAPEIVAEFTAMGVDIVLVLPFCPQCHMAAGILARAIERRGLPTTSMTTLRKTALSVKPPRASFLDFPLGCTAGRPRRPEQQREILAAALTSALKDQNGEWGLQPLPFEWNADGSRDWHDLVDDLYRIDHQIRGTVVSHPSKRAASPSIVGREEEFAVRCLC